MRIQMNIPDGKEVCKIARRTEKSKFDNDIALFIEGKEDLRIDFNDGIKFYGEASGTWFAEIDRESFEKQFNKKEKVCMNSYNNFQIRQCKVIREWLNNN